MLLKVSTNMPKNMEELTGKVTEVVAKILINKLDPAEVEQFIGLLQKGEVHINL